MNEKAKDKNTEPSTETHKARAGEAQSLAAQKAPQRRAESSDGENVGGTRRRKARSEKGENWFQLEADKAQARKKLLGQIEHLDARISEI